MRKLAILGVLLFGACGEKPAPPASTNPTAPATGDLRRSLVEAYERAADWLIAQQQEDGAWCQQPRPDVKAPSVAFTGLITAAFAAAPEELKGKVSGPASKGCAFILSKQNSDGSFGEGPSGAYLKTYATAIALMALSLSDRAKYADAIGNARGYLKHHQVREGEFKGGSGYGDEEPSKEGVKKGIANLSTTGFTAEGMHRSGLPQGDEFWKLVVEFVRRCQNNSETNADVAFVAKLKEQGLSVGDDGGLYYAPLADRNVHKAGTTKITDKEVIVSYGSMTYEGIKTYLYAGLKKTDPEVKAAIDWIRKNWSVEAHPGFPFDAAKRNHLRGLFYYYAAMARAMDVIGENPFRTFDGRDRDWAAELGSQLLKIQRENRMWANDNPAWMESDPVLTTSYVLNTMNSVLRNLK